MKKFLTAFLFVFSVTTMLLRNEDIVTYDGLSCSIR